MTLRADLTVARQGFELSLRLEAPAGQVVGLVGPNGSGKTTVLRAVAGLTRLTAGRIELDGEVLEATARCLRLPAAQRRTGVVFQDRLLFPHLSVADNVAFGPRRRGASRRAARAIANHWLDRTELADVARRRPAQLSGGQQQRVAVARALASDPRLLLLDEPLASMDAGHSVELRRFLGRQLREFAGPTVLVTHDPLDALVLCDRVVVLEAGHEVQSGPPHEVAQQPRSAHVAALMGLNLLRGRGDGTVVHLAGGQHVVVAHPIRGDALVSFRPSAVTLHRSEPHTSARNVWPGRVVGLTPYGDVVRVHVDGPVPVVADITPESLRALALTEGDPVWAAVKAVEAAAYPA